MSRHTVVTSALIVTVIILLVLLGFHVRTDAAKSGNTDLKGCCGTAKAGCGAKR